MKSKFPGYYRPTKENFSKIWTNCWFVVDANVLLNLYRYSQGTSNQLIELFRQVQSRLWIPHQAASEYHRNRLKVISGETKAYAKTIHMSRDLVASLSSDSYRNHPFADPAITKSTLHFLAKLEEDLDVRMKKRYQLISDDPLKEIIADIFSEGVGEPLSEEREKELAESWEVRFNSKIPPGYRDSKKEDGRGVNDLKIWFQIIDWAKINQKDVIFITDDRKDDWRLEHEGKTLGPKPQLVEEIRREANVQFYMYQPDQFMKQATFYLDSDVSSEAVDEAKNLSNSRKQKVSDYEMSGIPGKYKAVRKFVQYHEPIRIIIQAYADADLDEYSTTNDPKALPDSLISMLERVFEDFPESFSAVQAAHSMKLEVLEAHFRRCKVTQDVFNDALFVNRLPGYFIRLMFALKNECDSPESVLRLLELRNHIASRRALERESA